MLTLHPCRQLADYETVHGLLAEMGLWDAGEAAKFGVPVADTLAAYYGDTPAALLAAHTAPGSDFHLARFGGEPAGCAGFSRWGDGIAEVKKLYVRPAFRGKRIARSLMETVLDGMRAQNFRHARLVTTRFMPEAVALYGSFGFERCPPFEPLPENFVPFTLFMQRAL